MLIDPGGETLELTLTRWMFSLWFVCLLIAGCGGSSGDGGAVTKQDECNRLYAAYCDREDPLCDDAMSRHCPVARQQACAAQYDGTCGAAQAIVDEVTHEIVNIIEPQGTCNGLRSLDERFWDIVRSWEGAACVGGGGGDDAGPTQAELCQDAARQTCQKLLALGCIDGTEADCVQTLLAGGAIPLDDGEACSDTTPASAASAAQQATHDQWVADVAAAEDCATFGF